MNRLVTIATFDFPSEAHTLKVLLEQHGLEVFLADDNLVGTNWFLSNSVGGAKIQVPESQVEEATKIIAENRQDSRQNLKSSAKPDVEFECEECGKTISFSANRRGGVETCPYCRKYVDVPD